MFSLFTKANAPKKIKDFTFNELIKTIKDHPQKDHIESLRAKRKKGDSSYHDDKRKLLSFTPNCSVHSARKFSDGDFSKNFKAGSEYIYIDIDGIEDAVSYKNEFIEKYSDIVSLVAVSSSLGGLFILIKLNRLISSVEDFSIVWEHFNTNVFAGKVDPNTKDFNRVNFITSDPGVYVNYENEYDIKDIGLIETSKIEKRTFTANSIQSTEISSKRASNIEIGDVLNNLIFRTEIHFNKNEILKYQLIEDYVEVTQFGAIPDGKKRSTFTAIIIALKYLNPETEKEKYIHAYLKCINGTRCTEKMDHKELDKLFNNTIDLVKNKNVKPPFKVKRVHTNKNSKEPSTERHKLGKEFSDMNRVNNTMKKIQNAIIELEASGVKKITNAAICRITGLCRNTVSNRRKELEVYNINELIEQVNESYADDKSRFHNKGYIAKEIIYDNSIEENIENAKEDGIETLMHNEVIGTQIQDETVLVIDNTIEEKQDGEGTLKHTMDMASFIQRFNAELRYLEPWNRNTNYYSPYTIRKIALRESIEITGFDMDFDREWNKKYAHAL